jgi:hypothetical protein
MLLPEAQQAAQGDHGHDDNDLGQVDVLTGAQRQPVVGDKTDHRQGQQHIDKRVVQGLEELHDSVWRLVVGHFVIAFALQAGAGIQFGQAVLGRPDVGQGGRQAVLRFAGGTHRQFAVMGGAVLVGQLRGFYGAHSVYSCRHTHYLPGGQASTNMPSRNFLRSVLITLKR